MFSCFSPEVRKNRRAYLSDSSFNIGGHPMEFVDSFAHLGHVISSDLDDRLDVEHMRLAQINQVK